MISSKLSLIHKPNTDSMKSHTKYIKKHYSFAKSSPQKSKPPLLKNGAKTEELFKNITDPHFGDKAEEYRAITAILVAGIYHLNLYTGHNGVTFCGIEMKTEEGRKKIEKALVDIIDFAYNK